MPCDLLRIDAAAWTALAVAVTRPESGFRYLNLCSVDGLGRPQARMVVLRRVDGARRVLEIHTDVRSPKWQELAATPRATVLGFCAQQRLQLRLQGAVELHAPDSECAGQAWAALPPWTRQTYAGGPPGDECAFKANGEGHALAGAVPEAEGRTRFGVVTFHAETLDWFQLQRQDNHRAMFTYDVAGRLVESRWVNP